MSRVYVLSLVVVALFVAACHPDAPRSGATSNAPPLNVAPGTFVTISEINPDPRIPLRVGERVKLHVVAGYMLEAETGTIALVVQAADTTSVAQNMEVISRGNGKSVLDAEFTVPDTRAVQVFVPIHAQGQRGGTSIVDSRAYRVEGK
jgi:hypothetical protein